LPDFLVPRTPSTIHFEKDVVAVVETNLDDVTGEILARTVERLLEEGAFDATVTPFLGKKGRMGQTVRVVCKRGTSAKFGQILVEETGTLGVKTTEWTRMILPRDVISVSVKVGNFRGKVSVKVARIGGSLRIKPELEDAKKIATSEKIPLREVMEIISKEAVTQIPKA